jgi:DNA polymerase III epsilon subunit family exonuclease
MNLDQPVAEIEFTAFDFETTGLTPGVDRIVEFGAARFRGGQIIATFGRLANPGIVISEEASAVSGITNAMVAGQPSVEKTLPEFIQFTGDTILLAHNAPFDLAFLRAALLDSGMTDVKNPIIDTQVLAKRAFPKQKSYSLQNLIAFLKIPPNTAHRAEDDAVMCMKLFHACVESLSFMGDLTLGEVLT